MFVLQVASVKGSGGIATAVAHYERMFRSVGVRSAVLFRGPSFESLRAGGSDMIAAPRLLTSPLSAFAPELSRVRTAVLERAGSDTLAVIVHSDRALPALRRMFSRACMITPCHSDKLKHKAHADLVVTLNPAQQALALTAFPGKRIRELGNPFAPVAGSRGPNWDEDAGGRVRANFLGRLEGFKDPMTALKAFAAADLPPHAEMRVIGTGPLEAELRTFAATSARPIDFAGWLEAPFSHFGQGDLLVLPSTWESYSYVVREALQYGVPIVASDIMVHRDALGGGAFGALFPPGDSAGLARTLEAAFADLPGRRAKAELGREALLARYGPDPFWRELSSEIERLPGCDASLASRTE
ncbi:MAG: glycosyltransferase [Terricaulis sp.]